MFTDPTDRRVFVCAANSVYILCQKLGMAVSYKECEEMLPVTGEGTSMLDVKKALIRLGLQVEALRISVDELAEIHDPGVVWISFEQEEPRESRLFGHYFTLWPVSEGVVQVLDYPLEPAVLSADLWVRYLRSRDVAGLSVLLCRRAGEIRSKALLAGSLKGGSERRLSAPVATPHRQSATVVLRKRAPKPPSAHCDFGTVAEGTTLTHSFVLENRTGRELHISKFQKSCSCSSLTSDDNTLAPGKRCTVLMETSVAGLSSKQAFSGAVIFSPTDAMPPVRLLATGFVRGRIEVNPHVLDLGAHRRESGPITKKVRVEATEYGNAVNVSRVRSSSPSVMVRFDPLTDAAPCVGEITATFYPEQAVGMYRSRIDVFLDNGRRPATSCIVEAQVHSEFLVKPSALLIRQADGTGVTELQIQHFAGRSIRVMAVRSTRGTVKLAKAVHSNIGDNQTTNMEFSLSMGEDRLSRGEILVDVIVGDEQDIRTVQVPFVSVGRHSSDG